jgi:hypothetical protein
MPPANPCHLITLDGQSETPELNLVSRMLLTFAMAALLAGCGAGGETSEGSKEPQPATDVAPPPPTVPQKRLEFETRTDTVTTVHRREHGTTGAEGRGVQVRFMVQVGAFKDPHKAAAVQAEARKRFQMPVLNDFHAALGLYQIRLGFFDSRVSANAFRQRMIQEYPADYRDSWVVQLKR